MTDIHAHSRWPWLGGVALAWLGWGLINASRLKVVGDLSWPTALRYGLPDGLIWLILTPALLVMARRFEMRAFAAWRGVIAHLLASLACAFVHSALDSALGVLWDRIGSPELFAEHSLAELYVAYYREILTHTFHINLIVYFLALGIAHYTGHSRRLADGERKSAELKAQLTHSRLLNLERQLRPHFLFSALHTVSGLMSQDPQQSQRVLARLGDMLRISLRYRDAHLITLAEEMELVSAYLEVEQARFAGRLTVDLEIPRELLTCRVPVFLLQPIVENAVYHGVSKNLDHGKIAIHVAVKPPFLCFTVRDNGPGFQGADLAANGGIGLTNLRERLSELYGMRQKLQITTDKGVCVTIEIPMQEEP